MSSQKFVKNLAKAAATLVILSPLANPSFAQSEELKRLTKELLGSAFDNHSSRLAPLNEVGNPTNLKPIIGNIIDDYANKQPRFGRVYDKNTAKVVELLIPIKTGLEYSILQSKYPNIKIQESPTGVAILADSAKKALPMYLLGKRIQKEFGYSFELAYSDGHPDLNMAWLTPFRNVNVAKINQTPVSNESKTIISKPILSSNASDLGKAIAWRAPWTKTNKPFSPRFASTNFNKPSSKNTVTIEPTTEVAKTFPKLTPPPLVKKSDEYSFKSIAFAIDKTSSEATTKNNRVLPKIKIEKTSNLLARVNISPVHLNNNRIGSSNLVATNKKLNYVYVEVANNHDIDKLNKRFGAVVLRGKNDKLLARVGVYSNSKLGRRLRETKINQLRSEGFTAVAFNAKFA